MNSRERHRAKRKAADAARRRRAGFDDAGARFGRAEDPLPAQLIDAAISAVHHGRPAEFERWRDLLVAGPGGAAGVQVVNRALLIALQTDVEEAWRRGWQPWELVRAARRECSARHAQLVADACAAQLREYPVGRSQLEAVWWEHDDHFVDRWAQRHGVDRAAAVTTAVEVLHLLLTMPPVEPVGPLPGAADGSVAAGTDGGTAEHLDQRLLDKVRALLAKAEATDFPEEAEACTAKAQELMARHRIDHALLAAANGTNKNRDRPGGRRFAVDSPYESAKSLLLQVVAGANSCRAVWMKRFGLVAVVGYAADLDAVEVLFTSLLVQATRAMTGAGSRTDRYGRSTTRSFRQSFLTAYASRIGERLSAASDQVSQEAAASERGAELVPVLAARTEAVNDAFDEQFQELTQVSTTVNNAEGWASGRAAADRAVLHGRDELAP